MAHAGEDGTKGADDEGSITTVDLAVEEASDDVVERELEGSGIFDVDEGRVEVRGTRLRAAHELVAVADGLSAHGGEVALNAVGLDVLAALYF